MQISPIPSANLATAGQGDSARLSARSQSTRTTVRRDREPTPPPGLVGSSQMVEFDRHAGTGAQMVKFIDKHTGEVVNEFPAEQVLDAVTNLMKMIHEQEA